MSKKKKRNQTKLKDIWADKEKGEPAIVFLSIALALFLAFVVFFAWHTAAMRNYEINYVKINGTIVDIESRHSSGSLSTHTPSRTVYHYVISYSYEGTENTFTDRTGNNYAETSKIGSRVKVYVNPQNPKQAEMVTSAGFVSVICACFFAFFCVTYSVGMNFVLSIKGSSIFKRLLFVWGILILLGIAFLLLFWLGLPNSGFGEIFARIEGAVGVTVVSGLVLLAFLTDVLLTKILTAKINEKSLSHFLGRTKIKTKKLNFFLRGEADRSHSK